MKLLQLAARNVRRNRRRSVITLLAVLVGVFLVTILRGFTYASAKLMLEDVVKGRTGALQIHRQGFMSSVEATPTHLHMPYSKEMLERIGRVPGVVGVSGRIRFSGLVSNGVAQTMFVGRGIDLANESKVCPRSGDEVKEGGRPLALGDEQAVLVGFELAESLKVVTAEQKRALQAAGKPEAESVFDAVALQTTSPGGRANALQLAVKGLTLSSFPFENKRVAQVTLQTAQALLGLDGRVTEYAVAVRDIEETDRVAAALRAELGPEYEVHTWRELQPFVRDLLVRHDLVLGGIAVVLFVIILTGIVNTMLMSVFERVREIGTMLAVGMRRRQIVLLFVFEAGFIGLFGGVAGAVLSRALLAALAYKGIPLKLASTSRESLLEPSVTPSFVAMSVAIAVVGALVAALYPAYRAARLRPVDALRST